jgi:hypothetical protein
MLTWFCRDDGKQLVTCSRTLVCDDSADGTPQSLNILALDFEDREPVPLEGLCHIVALEIFGRVTSDGDVVIIYSLLRSTTATTAR